MKNLQLSFFLRYLALLCFFGLSIQSNAQVSQNGLLQVNGNKVVNSAGQSVSFAGPSLFWSNNGWGGEKFYNAGVVSWVKQDWNAGIIRAAMGVEDGGGYFEDPGSNKSRVETIVNAAIANDMYVIIDWHSHHANEHDWAAAYEFFEEMAQKYGHLDNVMYEIFNEPLQVSWSAGIKPYAESIISAIRKHDPDNIVIVGTPTWSQDVDQAANDPINQANVAYTLHFYSGSHGQSLRNKGDYALSKGLALFVTEWGSVNANGDGAVNYDETNAWVSWMKQNGISHCNWSINDKSEGASALHPGSSTTGGWSSLTASGSFAKEIMQSYSGNGGSGDSGGDEIISGNCQTLNLPGTVQAEAFCKAQGIQTESTTDNGGGENIGYVDDGDWLEYSINVPNVGNYTVEYRVASENGGSQLRLDQNEGNDVRGTVDIPATGGWQNWSTVSHEVNFPTTGEQNIGIYAVVGGVNINWIKLTPIGGDDNNDDNNNNSTQIPGKIEAEAYSSMSGIQTEATSDNGGGDNIGWFDANDWVKYNVNSTTAGDYTLNLRVASEGGGNIIVQRNNANVATLNVPATGGWQSWQDLTTTLNLPAGEFEITLTTTTGGININYLDFATKAPCSSTSITASLSPENTSLALNESVQFNFSATDNCGNNVSGSPAWSGNAPNGYFTAGSIGQHTITAELNGVVATAIVTVSDDDNGDNNNGGFVVSRNGLLQVNGNKVVNKNGQSVSFAGPSLFWSNNNWGAERFYNADLVSYMKNDWNAGIIRAAMGVEDGGGYFDDAASNKARVETIVNAAIANDMYVIIDWHSHHANEHDWSQAANFFAEMAQKYGQYDNVLYEIYNEPLQISWSSGIKPYAESIISSIRQHDPDNIIIVGTPTWSQDVDQAANDPINQSNIAYTLHYYAGSHGQSLRDKGNYALSRGLALFVTEWGSVNANGDGGVNYNETWAWIDWMKANGISHCKWSINDKSEGASFLNPGASSTGGWSNLTASGAFAKEIMLSYDYGVGNDGNGDDNGDNGDNNGSSIRLEAENYTFMSGVEAGGNVVGYIDAGDWLAFHNVNIPSNGNYTISYRVTSPFGGGKVQLEGNSGTTVYGSVDVPNTGGWDSFQTVSHSAYLNAGSQDFGIGFPAGAFNLDWIEISPESNGRHATSAGLSLENEIKVIAYPNPASSVITLSGLASKFDQLRVFNIDGKMKNTINVKDNDQYILDINNLQKGVYLIQLLGNDQAKTVRFIKQ